MTSNESGKDFPVTQPENREPGMDKKSRKSGVGVAIAIAAVLLALVILVSIIAGQLLVSFIRYQRAARKADTNIGTTSETIIDGDTGSGEQTVETREKHFSIEDASRLPDDGNRKAMSTVEIASKVSPATVSINVEVLYGTPYGETSMEASGSGFIITEDGYIVTNYHVIAGAEKVSVVVPGYSEPFSAEVIGADNRMDIAVLKIESSEKFPQVTLGDSDLLQVGELAVAIGNPFGEFAGTVTVGVISAVDREITIDSVKYNLLQTDASINSGNSGGALVNSYGEVIGVTNAKMTSAEGIGFAIPINDVKSIIEELINNGFVSGRPILGVTVVTIDQATAEQFNWPTGLFVRDVTEGGPADQAGLICEDIITHINDQRVETTEALLEIRDALSVGDEMRMTVYRDGETLQLTLVLGEGKIT